MKTKRLLRSFKIIHLVLLCSALITCGLATTQQPQPERKYEENVEEDPPVVEADPHPKPARNKASVTESETDIVGESEAEAKPETEAENVPDSEGEHGSKVESEDGSNKTETANPESGKPESEPEGEDESHPVAEAVGGNLLARWIALYSIFICLIVIGNVTIMCIVLKNKKSRKTQAGVFFVSLLVSRTTVALFVMPGRIVGLYSEQWMGSFICKSCHYFGDGSATVSVFSTMATALAKYRMIKNRPEIPFPTTIKQLVAMWVVGYLWAIRSYILNDLYIVNTNLGPMIACITDPKANIMNAAFIFVDFACLFCLPAIIVVVYYTRSRKALNIRRRTITIEHLNKHPSYFNQVRSIHMLVIVMQLFTVCHLSPYIFRFYLYVINANEFNVDFAEIERWLYWISYSNPWLNVIVYIYFQDDIKKGLKQMCCCQAEDSATTTDSFVIQNRFFNLSLIQNTWGGRMHHSESSNARMNASHKDTEKEGESRRHSESSVTSVQMNVTYIDKEGE